MPRPSSTAVVFTVLVRFVEFLIAGFLTIRFFFKLLNASNASSFVQWIYGITEPLINPFKGIFPAPSLQTGYIIEFTTLLALVVYGFIFYLIAVVVMEIGRYSSRNDQV